MKRILTVDDNKDILEILRYILEESGYEVDTLSDGHRFFEQIHKHMPDLILLDVMLGDMDGRELCKMVKTMQATQNIPVIMISATHTMSNIKQTCAPDAFLAKPFDIKALLRIIKEELNRAA